jgi:L-aminopeptidase/D-esterase-like protein
MTLLHPGPRNLITDVDRILVGQAEDMRAWTGVTVILPEEAAVAAVDVRGGGPGTRETDALDPSCLIDRIDALVLTGGSVFGLAAASAVTDRLGQRGIGFPAGTARVPIVPTAVLFDLLNGGDKQWGGAPPYAGLGHSALKAVGRSFALGNAGAGLGAKAGLLKGGLGSVSMVAGDGLQIGALIAVNPRGSVVIPGQASFWAWPFEQENELGGQPVPRSPVSLDTDPIAAGGEDAARVGANTTIGAVATNAVLTKTEALRVAIMAQDGYARAIRPVHTPFDGDMVFALATGTWQPADAEAMAPGSRARAELISRIGTLAADCVARAVARGVYEATGLGRFPAYRDLHGKHLRAS